MLVFVFVFVFVFVIYSSSIVIRVNSPPRRRNMPWIYPHLRQWDIVALSSMMPVRIIQTTPLFCCCLSFIIDRL